MKSAGPCAMVILGASGDLTKRKLIPALYNLAAQKLLPEEFAVIGMSRTPLSDEQFREQLRGELARFEKIEAPLWRDLSARIHYVAGDATDPAAYARLAKRLGALEKERKTGGNALFYLATAPEFFAVAAERAAAAGLTKDAGCWRRVIVEKPFGRDLESARALNRALLKVLRERQIYRIDHYLGKETVQNLMVLRFANAIFEPVWNRRYVDHVQISVAESLGVEHRGAYYDGTGALRDMIPSHMFQLLALTAMEPPASFEADAVRDEQVKVLSAAAPLAPGEIASLCARGQYGPGALAGSSVPGYRSEPAVAPGSATETFAAVKLLIDNWRWAGVPFYLRTGKRLPCRSTEIVIQFQRVPHVLFSQTAPGALKPNQLVIRIQPDEGIALAFEAKVPGAAVRLGTVDMNFRYRDYFKERPSTGYERLLYDCMLGDATLFRRTDMLEAGWQIVAPILDAWRTAPNGFPNYAAGTWGPPEAEDLIKRDGRAWRACAG